MLKKTFVVLVLGVFFLCLFSFFSAFPQNHGQLPSVHSFAYNCMLGTEEYLMGYNYRSDESAKIECHFNLRLSLLVVGYGVAGACLLTYSLRRVAKIVTFKKTFVLLFTGIFLLCLLSFFSSIPQNPWDKNTIHLVTYHCMLETVAYPQLLMSSSMEAAAEKCHFNPNLSMLVVGCGISGICLMAYSLRQIKGSVQTKW